MINELRPHQIDAMARLRQSIAAGKRRIMLQAPTGSGKTMIAAAVVDGALSKGKRVLFTVPALSLVNQTVEAFWEEGIREVGVIQGQHEMTNWARPVQVASVQTLARREIPNADVVVVDEAHRWFSFYEKWFMDPAWQAKPFIGLSATPWTRGLGKYYQELIIAATTSELIEKGFLSPFRVFAPSHPDLSEVRTVAGDYHEGDLGEVMGEQVLVADVVETWLRKGEGRSTLCFAVDRAHAKLLQEKFEAAGVSTGYIDAFTEMEERTSIRNKFHDGLIKVVCNVGCLTTGVDWDVRCIVLARPTKSEMLFVQIIGRGLRTADGKDDCLILDHSDTTLRLGFVTEIHHDELDNGKTKAKPQLEAKVRLPKECPQCAFLKPPRMSVCPACGFKNEVDSKIEFQDGDLVELNPSKKKKKSEASQSDKQEFYAQLRFIAQERSYSDGWCSHKYKEKFGVWPSGMKEVRPLEPTPQMRSWIKSKQIAWAKSKKNVEHAQHQ
jgi:superfamily II DNA or RNA helicase